MARNRLFDDDVLVIGLGRFGAAAALELHATRPPGHRRRAGPAASPRRSSARSAKSSTADASAAPARSRTIRARELQASPSSASARRSRPRCSPPPTSSTPGCPSIWAKALSPEHERILDRIGVQHVISPRPTPGAGWRTSSTASCWTTSSSTTASPSSRSRPPQRGHRLHAGAEPDPQQVRRHRRRRQGARRGLHVRRAETKVSAHDTLIVSGPTELIERLRRPALSRSRTRARAQVRSEDRDPAVLPSASTMAISSSPSSSETTRIGRRLSVGRKPMPLAKATARPLSVPTQ